MQHQKQAMQRRETDLARLSEAVQGAAVRRFTDGAVSEVAALQPGDAITLRGAAVRADCVVQSVHKNAQGGMTL